MSIKKSILSFCLVIMIASSVFAQVKSFVSFIDYGKGVDGRTVAASNVSVTLVKTGEKIDGESGLLLSPMVRGGECFIKIRRAKTMWDVRGYKQLTFCLTNKGEKPVTVGLSIGVEGVEDMKEPLGFAEGIMPGETRVMTFPINHLPVELAKEVGIIGTMRGLPAQKFLPLRHIKWIGFTIMSPKKSDRILISTIRAENPEQQVPVWKFMPFVDEFGQYRHSQWPGKILTVQDFEIRRKNEASDLAVNPGPSDRDRFGGFSGIGKMRATGFFRTQKIGGKWWLVDPEGRLFWSNGMDCVSLWHSTPITGRPLYFMKLPKKGVELAKYYGRGSWAPVGYYKDKGEYETFSHLKANLHRKYGPAWQAKRLEIAIARLKSWGFNTIGNWSGEEITALDQMPYVAMCDIKGPKLAASESYWTKFHDVFSPEFRPAVKKALATQKSAAGDKWCIGFFVDNELNWGKKTSLAEATLKCPATQPAKIEFVKILKAKYKTIKNLNRAWGKVHKSWDALLGSAKFSVTRGAKADLLAFNTKMAETYFKIVRDEIKAIAPNQLYMGCRFQWVNDVAVSAAAKYCDIISYNKYSYSVENLKLPDKLDKPVIIGEYHFGALDRGMFHTGLRGAKSQAHRAELFTRYIKGALRNPYIVGVHWFQYSDQPLTGRGDGENYQIGWVDICDTPYQEMVTAGRAIGKIMYRYRLKVNDAEAKSADNYFKKLKKKLKIFGR